MGYKKAPTQKSIEKILQAKRNKEYKKLEESMQHMSPKVREEFDKAMKAVLAKRKEAKK